MASLDPGDSRLGLRDGALTGATEALFCVPQNALRLNVGEGVAIAVAEPLEVAGKTPTVGIASPLWSAAAERAKRRVRVEPDALLEDRGVDDSADEVVAHRLGRITPRDCPKTAPRRQPGRRRLIRKRAAASRTEAGDRSSSSAAATRPSAPHSRRCPISSVDPGPSRRAFISHELSHDFRGPCLTLVEDTFATGRDRAGVFLAAARFFITGLNDHGADAALHGLQQRPREHRHEPEARTGRRREAEFGKIRRMVAAESRWTRKQGFAMGSKRPLTTGPCRAQVAGLAVNVHGLHQAPHERQSVARGRWACRRGCPTPRRSRSTAVRVRRTSRAAPTPGAARAPTQGLELRLERRRRRRWSTLRALALRIGPRPAINRRPSSARSARPDPRRLPVAPRQARRRGLRQTSRPPGEGAEGHDDLGRGLYRVVSGGEQARRSAARPASSSRRAAGGHGARRAPAGGLTTTVAVQ